MKGKRGTMKQLLNKNTNRLTLIILALVSIVVIAVTTLAFIFVNSADLPPQDAVSVTGKVTRVEDDGVYVSNGTRAYHLVFDESTRFDTRETFVVGSTVQAYLFETPNGDASYNVISIRHTGE